MPSPRPRIYALVTIPPPHTGMTIASQAMMGCFNSLFAVVDLSVKKPAAASKLIWFIYRQIRYCLGLIYCAIFAQKGDTLYFVLDSGKGIWANLFLQFPLILLCRCRIIIHHHVYSYIGSPDWRINVILRSLKRRSTNVVLSQRMGKDLQRAYGTDLEIFVLGNANFINIETVRQPRAFCKSVGFISNITRSKGIELYMEMIRSLSSGGPHVFAHIAGPINDPLLLKEVQDFVAEDPEHRRWWGPVYGEKKKLFFTTIDVLAFPSMYKNEAQPITIYEALSNAIPVLATNIGCIPDQLSWEEWCFSGDNFVKNACSKVSEWMNDSEKYRTETQRATFLWSKNLSSAKIALDTMMGQMRARRN